MPTKQELEDQLEASKRELEALKQTQAGALLDPMTLFATLAKSQQDSQTALTQSIAQLAQTQIDSDLRMEARLNNIMQNLNPAPPGNAPGQAQVGGQAQAPARQAAVPKVNLATPQNLESDYSIAKFQQWRAIWDDYARVVQLDKQDRENQLAVFRNCLSMDMRSVLTEVIGVPNHTVANPLTVAVLLDRIQAYFRSKRNIALDCVAFDNRKQRESEDFDSYLVTIRELARDAELCNTCLDRRLTTRIMSGIKDEETRTKLLALKPFPNLQQVIDLCRSEESAHASNKALQSEKAISRSRLSRSNSRSRNFKRDSRSKSPKPGSSKQPCRFCGKEHEKGRKNCPAGDHKCCSCGKIGHFPSMCYQKQKQQEKKTSRVKINSVIYKRRTSDSSPKIDVDVFSSSDESYGTVKAIPDSGAEAFLAGKQFLDAIGFKLRDLDPPPDMKVSAGNSTGFKILGQLKCKFRFNGIEDEGDVLIASKVSDLLLPWFTCEKFGLLHYPEKSVRKISTSSSDLNKLIDDLPDEPTFEQLETLRKKLIDEFKDVFTMGETLQVMDGPEMSVKLKEDAIPFTMHAARQLPLASRDDVKKQLEEMVQKGVLAVVTEPTDWVHPLVVVPKPDGTWRICVDLTKLNKYVKRPYHPLVTPRDAVSEIGGSKYFTTLDAKHGYWQIPMDEEAQALTTFITPWGRYKFLRAPMGLSSSSDVYCQRGDAAMAGLQGVSKVVDDVLVHAANAKDHVKRVVAVLERCRKHQITLNPNKFKFAKHQVKYVGFLVNKDGITADPSKLEAISKFPTPTNLTELRSFMGMVNQLGSFTPHISQAAGPLRDLLKAKNVFQWLDVHTKAFEEMKAALVSAPVLAPFDPSLPTMLQTDASRLKGLGYALLQCHDDNWKLVQCGSRFITDTESRYAMIELEMLGVAWAMKKCKIYLLGLPHFELIVDHKPLVPVLNKYTLDMVENPRLQRLKEKVQQFIFTADWKKGKEHSIPDALSRAPIADPKPSDLIAEADTSNTVHATVRLAAVDLASSCDSLPDPYLDALRLAAKDDIAYQDLLQTIQAGFPSTSDKCHPNVRPFWNVRDCLSLDNGIALLGTRLIIPKSKRSDVLQRLHDSHQGIERTKRRARQTVYWPGINSDITNVVQACSRCQLFMPSQAQEPLTNEAAAVRPFEDVSSDLFSYSGHTYLIYADRYSGWPCLHAWKKYTPTAKQVCNVIRKWFMTYGCPQRMRSDNGPQYKAKSFADFLADWNVIHVTSSPEYPQSNGHAEAAVKAMKNLVKKLEINGDLNNDKFARALLEFRNTPRDHGQSPAQLLFGNPLRTCVPVHSSALGVETPRDSTMNPMLSSQVEERYNTRSRSLTTLKIGTQVYIQNAHSKLWNKSGIIVSCGNLKNYKIKLNNGTIYWRNRKFLRPVKDSKKTVTFAKENEVFLI